MVRLNEVVGQPWRYCCPHCDAYDVLRIFSASTVRGKTYMANMRGRKQAEYDRSLNWRCNQCGERLDEVYDGKNDEVISTQVVQKD